jgi:geranylgeranyl diphosphate synthase type II
MDFDISAYMRNRKEWVDNILSEVFVKLPRPKPLFDAMSYSLTAGGKRLRPVLMMAAFELFAGDGKKILPFACAMEMVHTYSLIHDDLPAMDNDDLRRGKPTCHKVFGEAIAILAGDGLLTEAFALITDNTRTGDWPVQTRLKVVSELASAAGITGMVGGQAMDILAEHKKVDLETVRFIHLHKTAALIRASVRIGAILGETDDNNLARISRYGESIGIAFQIVDDILDVEGSTEILGKSAGADSKMEKATYPAVASLARAKKKAREHIASAQEALQPFGARAEALKQIADLIFKRNN